MTRYRIAELAGMAGISVRALHHYDAIGLLKPAFVGDNRYRYYGEDELLRLQQILIHRELGIPLGEIAAILDDPDFDRLEALRGQRDRLAREAKRYALMVETIDRTIDRLKGDRAMKDADLYSGIVSPEKQAEYEAWLVDRFGGDMEERIADSRQAYSSLTAADRAAMMAELQAVEQGLAEGLRRGIPPQAAALEPLIERHRHWVSRMWDRPCPPQAYSGLADLYLGHPDFVARYEQIEKGFAQYLADAMRAWARRQG